MVKSPFVDKDGLKKGAWSEDEDDKLKAYVLKYGHWNWKLLPKFAGLARCGKSCRLRWYNYLKPGLKRGNFTEEEQELIKKLHDEHGNKWSTIAAKVPGRTDNEIKNYWHTHFKEPNRSTRAPYASKVKKIKSSSNDCVPISENVKSHSKNRPKDSDLSSRSGDAWHILESSSSVIDLNFPLESSSSSPVLDLNIPSTSSFPSHDSRSSLITFSNDTNLDSSDVSHVETELKL